MIKDEMELGARYPYVKKHFGKRLKHLIKFKGYKVSEFANLLGWSRDTLYRYFRSEMFPTNESFDQILNILGVDIDAFAYPAFPLGKISYHWLPDDSDWVEEPTIDWTNVKIDDVKDIYEIIEIIKEAVEENKNNAVFVHNLKFLLLTIDEFISDFENSNEKES